MLLRPPRLVRCSIATVGGMPKIASTSGRAPRLHELARVGVQRFEIAALAFGEHDVERERRFARARDAGDHREFSARNFDVDRFQVVLARVAHADVVASAELVRSRSGAFSVGGDGRRRRGAEGRLVIAQRFAGVRRARLHDFGRRAGADDLAARVAAFRPEVDDPVRRAHDVEVVLDDDERVTRGDQLAQRLEQLRDVFEVQAGGGLVEQEQ